MLTPEQAKEELKRHRHPSSADDLAARVAGLPSLLSSIALSLVPSIKPRNNATPENVRRDRNQCIAALENLGDGDRRKLFGALFPPIADYVELSWQLQVKLPFQIGFGRKAFRAPNHPRLTAGSRYIWLQDLVRTVVPYRFDLEFLIVWAAYLGWGAEQCIGLLLAGALDLADDAGKETLHKLVSIVNGDHEIARPGRYSAIALLSSSQPEAWSAVERLLLAAQRQEGLRQVVIESVDFAHPESYRRILRLILEHKLSRFAAIARGVAVWFGLHVDSAEGKWLDRVIAQTLENLDDSERLRERIERETGESLYLALWAAAFRDAVAAGEQAGQMLQDSNFERRYAAAHLLSELATPDACPYLIQCLADSDLRVALLAAESLPRPANVSLPGLNEIAVVFQQLVRQPANQDALDLNATFVALQSLIPRVPEDQSLAPAIWEWNRIPAKRSQVAAKLITYRGDRPFAQLSCFLPDLDAPSRSTLLRAIQAEVKKTGQLATDQRDIAFALLRDLSDAVRELAFRTLEHAEITAREAETIEQLLSRKASDLRRGVLRLLLKQPAAGCRASIERLSNSTDSLMRQAADELRAEFEPQAVPAASLADGLGLFDPTKRTRPAVLRADLKSNLISPTTTVLLHSLDNLVDSRRETTVTFTGNDGHKTEQLLGNLKWFGRGEDLPLREVWDQWWFLQKRDLSTGAGLELARAFCILSFLPEDLPAEKQVAIRATLFEMGGTPPLQLKFKHLCREVLKGLCLDQANVEELTVFFDVLETYVYAVVSAHDPGKDRYRNGCRTAALQIFLRYLNRHATTHPSRWSHDCWRRYWGLLRFVDEGVAQADRQCPPLDITLEARRQGIASDADLYEQLLTPHGWRSDLGTVTTRKKSKLFESHPDLERFADRCRTRILDVESRRGDLPTPASPLALQLRSVYGAELVLTLLKGLGREELSRGYLRNSASKSVVFSHLLRVSMPSNSDTLGTFAQTAQRLELSSKKLADLALYAPQWAKHVEYATDMAGLHNAALWLHAHTKDTQWTVEEQIRELWFAELSECTPLTKQELLEGAVDVQWFRSMRSGISDKHWAIVLDSAKYASGGAGHKRAELFAKALAGELSQENLATNITTKRNQDSARAIGLLPLCENVAEQRADILQRYEILQQFLGEGKKFGAQRQASEKLAYAIGLANLARTASYPDPQRLSWAMEAEASADLRSGSIEAVDGAVRGVLSINALGEPELIFEKNGKTLKDLPAASRKAPALTALRARKTQLAQQTSRMRQSLEEAMIRGDRFTQHQLREFESHPLLKPMISCLLFVSENGRVHWVDEMDDKAASLRIAHPVDLLSSGRWPAYQQQCLELSRIQPFKQAFRELYLITEMERQDRLRSGRYEGQQVNPQQALAVIGKRGWVNVPEEGVRKTFHSDGISAWITFLETWFTPAEVDGLTVSHVAFSNRSDGNLIPLDQLNPRVFSEVMRDVDLMVSVAHRGGVDPEATASTTEMRSALIRETLSLLKISNVRLAAQHAFIQGKMGAYNVHLGSGTVHRQPGNSLCIIPVHSQHRGRIFLPFADNDPKTAEIVSKVILLAQDEKLTDPTILEQLR